MGQTSAQEEDNFSFFSTSCSSLQNHKLLSQLYQPLEYSLLTTKCRTYAISKSYHLCNNVAVPLTSHGEDTWRWWLAIGWHRRHPEGRGWLSNRGHGQTGGGHNRWGREWNHIWQIDIIHDERVVAMVKWTKVTTDTKSFFCGEKQTSKLCFFIHMQFFLDV